LIITPVIGRVPAVGSTIVFPSATTTYIITATGPGGSTTDSVTVTVLCPPTVVNFHHGILKDRYDAIYDLLGSDLPILAQQMQDKELIYATGDRAKYRIKRDHNIDGQTVTITYYLQCFSIPRPLASGFPLVPSPWGEG
jgi:hypothetical protein